MIELVVDNTVAAAAFNKALQTTEDELERCRLALRAALFAYQNVRRGIELPFKLANFLTGEELENHAEEDASAYAQEMVIHRSLLIIEARRAGDMDLWNDGDDELSDAVRRYSAAEARCNRKWQEAVARGLDEQARLEDAREAAENA